MILAKVHLFDGDWAEVKRLTQEIMDSRVYSLTGSYADVFNIDNEYNSEVILDVQYSPVLREWSMRDAGFIPPSMGGYCNIAPTQELVDSYIMLNGRKISDAGSGYDKSNPYADRDPRLAASIIYTGNSYRLADGSDKLRLQTETASVRNLAFPRDYKKWGQIQALSSSLTSSSRMLRPS